MLAPGQKILAHLLKDGLERGVVKPIPFVVFERENIIDAFRFMASGKHKGKDIFLNFINQSVILIIT